MFFMALVLLCWKSSRGEGRRPCEGSAQGSLPWSLGQSPITSLPPLVRLRCGPGQCPELEGLVGVTKTLWPSPENGAFELLDSLFPENCPRIVYLLVFLCLLFLSLGTPRPVACDGLREAQALSLNASQVTEGCLRAEPRCWDRARTGSHGAPHDSSNVASLPRYESLWGRMGAQWPFEAWPACGPMVWDRFRGLPGAGQLWAGSATCREWPAATVRLWWSGLAWAPLFPRSAQGWEGARV